MTHRYGDAKEAFVDEIKVDEYIELEGSKKAYEQLDEFLGDPTSEYVTYAGILEAMPPTKYWRGIYTGMISLWILRI